MIVVSRQWNNDRDEIFQANPVRNLLEILEIFLIGCMLWVARDNSKMLKIKELNRFMSNSCKKIKSDEAESSSYFEQYWRHCSALRNWFVAYGVGGAVLLLTDRAQIFQQIKLGTKQFIVIAFAIGIIVQILLAFTNKIIHWYIYLGKEDPDFALKRRYKASAYLAECFGIDIIADLISFFAFGVATIKLLTRHFITS